MSTGCDVKSGYILFVDERVNAPRITDLFFSGLSISVILVRPVIKGIND